MSSIHDKPTYAELELRLADLNVRYSNLLAAARATVAAHHDGETDPLAYLREELESHGQMPGAGLHPAQILALVTTLTGLEAAS